MARLLGPNGERDAVRLLKLPRSIAWKAGARKRTPSGCLRRVRPQVWSVARSASAESTVAGQLPSSLSASSECEPGVVHRPRGHGVQLGKQRTAKLVGGQDVQTLVAHERGRAGDRVERPLHLGPDALLDPAPTRPRNRRLGGAGEVEKVGALGVV